MPTGRKVRERNITIQQKSYAGATIPALCEEYKLSRATIFSIVSKRPKRRVTTGDRDPFNRNR